MVYGSDCRYLPIHFSEFMLLFFMRKRTKEENTRSPPSSYEGGREGEGEGEREEGREGGRERERERERERGRLFYLGLPFSLSLSSSSAELPRFLLSLSFDFLSFFRL